MKKVLLSSLLAFALSGMAFAQNTQPSKSQPPAKTTQQQQQQQQPNQGAVANKSTTKKSTAMTKPRHKRAHKKMKHTSPKTK